MSVELKGVKEVLEMLSPKLARKVINKTIYVLAKDVKEAEIEEMKKVFDRPTPFTLGSLYIRTSQSEMSGEVGFKDFAGKGTPASKYLQPQIYGGGREKKRSERYLGSYYVPGAKVRLNVYGNIPGSQITQILSSLKAFPEVGYMANVTKGSRKRNKKLRTFFMIKPGSSSHLHPGVYERTAKGLKSILTFIQSPQYKIRFKFYEVGEKVLMDKAQDRFNQEFDKVMTVGTEWGGGVSRSI